MRGNECSLEHDAMDRLEAIAIRGNYGSLMNHALSIVDNESPGSNEQDRLRLANQLINLAVEKNDYLCRTWTIYF